MIWESYVEWAVNLGQSDDEDDALCFSETALHVYKRYIKLNGQARDDLISYLLEVDRIEDALPVFEEIIFLENFQSK